MNKTIRRIAPVALVLIGLATLSFMADYGVTLRLKPQHGKTYTMSTKTNMMMMMEVQGQTMNQTQNMEIRQSFTATSVTDKVSKFDTQIEAIKMSMSSMGMKMEYDSEHPEKTSPMLAGQTKEMDAAIKKVGHVTYDALGNVIDSLDLDMSQIGACIIELPAKEVKVGSTWSFSKNQNVNNTEMQVNYTYTVTKVTKKSVDVNISGTVKGNNASSASKGGDGISGTYSGTASISAQTGIIVSSNLKTNISMTISEQGLSIPVTMVGTTTMEAK